jgi:hypothetical protein
MAIAQMSPTHEYAVYPLLKSTQNMVRRNTGGTHNPNGTDVRRVLQSTDPSQVSSSVRSPCTQKADYFWFKIGITHISPSSRDIGLIVVEVN